MTKIELEADNICLISIVDRNIETLQRAVILLKNLRENSGPFYLSVCESISKAQDDVERSREFLDKLFQEGNYPSHQ